MDGNTGGKMRMRITCPGALPGIRNGDPTPPCADDDNTLPDEEFSKSSGLQRRRRPLRSGVVRMKRVLIFVHRWLGVALCVVFLIWFPSGIGMMYWGFPTVTAADRLERSPVLDAAQVHLSPGEAWAKIGIPGEPGEVRLNTFDGRPVYRFGEGRGLIVYADTGEEQREISTLMVRRIASSWSGRPAQDAQLERLEQVDQWTVQQNLRNLRPVWKFSWPNGEQVYVSQATGEIVQYTTRASRIGAYLGPIPHWLYFTPLRKHGPEWAQLVIWSSAVGTFAAILGLIVGAWMYSPAKRYRYDGAPTRLPYRGQKRWHMLLGLVFGIATATWAFSGMLSMDPFGSDAGNGPDRDGRPNIQQALRGDMHFASFEAKHPREALAQLGSVPVKQLEFTTFAGEPIYMATLGRSDTRIVPISGEPQTGLDPQRIVDVVTKAAGPGSVETRLIGQYDRYYLDRHRNRPLPVILAQLNDQENSRYYIDPNTARVVGSYSDRDWVRRWLYNGLHSLNFPWLYNYRPLWDIVVITFMLGGTALSITSLVLAWRVIGRKLRGVVPGTSRDRARVSDDLALAD